MTVSCTSHILHEFAGRLDRLRGRLDRSLADSLGKTRQELEVLRAEAEGCPCAGLPAALGRLALLTEVWECLAAEGEASAPELAAFFQHVLEHLVQSLRAGDADLDTTWILQESLEHWGQYLDLLEPIGCERAGDLQDLSQPDPLDDTESPLVDFGGLLRLFTGSSPSLAMEEIGRAHV